MSKQALIVERLSRALTVPTSGVLGLVDELISASGEQDLRLVWQAGLCQVAIVNADSLKQIELPIQKSVFRAALARVAALCNERVTNSVSPYGGRGEITLAADPAKVIHVRFVNTPEEQNLEMTTEPLERSTSSLGLDKSSIFRSSVTEISSRG